MRSIGSVLGLEAEVSLAEFARVGSLDFQPGLEAVLVRQTDAPGALAWLVERIAVADERRKQYSVRE